MMLEKHANERLSELFLQENDLCVFKSFVKCHWVKLLGAVCPDLSQGLITTLIITQRHVFSNSGNQRRPTQS